MNKREKSELIQQAREADLLDYFRRSGYKIKQQGAEYYIPAIPGLCIKPDTNQWYNHYTEFGSTNNSINCLVYVLGTDFNQAVYELTGKDISQMYANEYPRSFRPKHTSPPRTQIVVTKKELQMPQQAENAHMVYEYMCKVRKIPERIVEELVHAKLLYQSNREVNCIKNGVQQTFYKPNAVFVHTDRQGKAIGAEIQGCDRNKRFKSLATGTGDSVFMYVPHPAEDGKIRRAYIFESAIDLMSFYSLCNAANEKMRGAAFISMAGLKPSVPKRMQAAGIEILSCVDNDDAGRHFEAENGFTRPEEVKCLLDRNGFKDWNDLLKYLAINPDVNVRDLIAKQKAEEKHGLLRRA